MERGARVLYGGGDEDGALPYQPIVEALERYLFGAAAQMRVDGLEDAPGDLARLMPGARLSAAPRDPLGDADIQRFRLFRRRRRARPRGPQPAAAARARRPPGADAADAPAPEPPSSRRHARADRLIVSAAHRGAGVASLRSAAATWAQIAQSAPGPACAERVTTDWRTPPRRIRPLVETLIRETEGNPLFVDELMRLQAAEGTSGRLRVPQGVATPSAGGSIRSPLTSRARSRRPRHRPRVRASRP